jgi:GNAT superfamily N-acetyltransferase
MAKIQRLASGWNSPSLPGQVFASKKALISSLKKMEWYRLSSEGGINIGFQHNHMDYGSGQNYWKLYAYDKDTPQRDVVGYLDYSEYDEKIYIDHIFVNPEFRRKGVGTALVRELERKAGEDGMEVVHGMMTEEGSALYESMHEK